MDLLSKILRWRKFGERTNKLIKKSQNKHSSKGRIDISKSILGQQKVLGNVCKVDHLDFILVTAK